MKRFLFILLFISYTTSYVYASLTKADSLFNEKRYAEALYEYNKQPNSLSKFYNLGNTYYYLANYPKAILNYHKALLLDPSDKDTQYNLNVAEEHIQKIETQDFNLFYISIIKNIADIFNSNEWCFLGLLSLVITSLLYVLFKKIKKNSLRKSILGILIITSCLSIVAFTYAFTLFYQFYHSQKAVVINTTEVINIPSSSGKIISKIPAGNIIKIEDSYQNWINIKTSLRDNGWINKKDIERITIITYSK